MTMRQIEISANPKARALAFLAEFSAADDDADIEVRIGHIESGAPAVVVSLNGKQHGFTSEEARRLAKIMEEAMNDHPNDPGSRTLPNIIMALRMGSDKAEQPGDHR